MPRHSLNSNAALVGALFLAAVSASTHLRADDPCPDEVHYGDASAASVLTIHSESGTRHFHTDTLPVVYRRITESNQGLEVRFPRFTNPAHGEYSYIWLRHARTFTGETGTYPAMDQSLVYPSSLGCFSLPPDAGHETADFVVQEWIDPRQGSGHLRASYDKTDANGHGYTAEIDTDDVVILETAKVQGELPAQSGGDGSARVEPEEAFIIHSPSRKRVRLKIFGPDNRVTIRAIEGFQSGRPVIASGMMGQKKLFIINRFSEDGVDIEWREIPFGSDIDVDAVASPEQARTLGHFGGHIISEAGYTRVPSTDDYRLTEGL